jgi:hypothetical protein
MASGMVSLTQCLIEIMLRSNDGSAQSNNIDEGG